MFHSLPCNPRKRCSCFRVLNKCVKYWHLTQSKASHSLTNSCSVDYFSSQQPRFFFHFFYFHYGVVLNTRNQSAILPHWACFLIIGELMSKYICKINIWWTIFPTLNTENFAIVLNSFTLMPLFFYLALIIFIHFKCFQYVWYIYNPYKILF